MSGVAVDQLAGRNTQTSDESRHEGHGWIILAENGIHLFHDLFGRVSPSTGSTEEVHRSTHKDSRRYTFAAHIADDEP